MLVKPGDKTNLVLKLEDGGIYICDSDGRIMENVRGFQLVVDNGVPTLMVRVDPVLANNGEQEICETNIVMSISDMLQAIRSQGFLIYNPTEKHG